MKKRILLFGGLLMLTACQNNKGTTDSTWDSVAAKYQTNESPMDTKRKTIDLQEYKFFIPSNYDNDAIEDAKNMEKNLFIQKEIDVQDLPLSTILFGGKYDKNNNIFITLMYLVNNTEKEIKDISFVYNIDLTAIQGNNEGEFQYNYSRVNSETIPPKSIIPIFLGTKDVSLKSEKDFYEGEDLSKIEVNNIIISYKDEIEESNK